jgi:glycosyltransferase involved in cell wall biosynthesis
LFEKSRVIKNGVKSVLLSSNKKLFTESKNKVRFGYVGGAGPVKGSHLIHSVFKDFPRNDYELICVDNLGNLNGKTADFFNWKITGNYRVRSAYTQDTIDEFFDEIDVLLFPSQCKESFGLAVREALIRHKWVVCTNGGGTVEDIIDGINGRVIPMVQDTSYLIRAVEEVFDIDWVTYKNPYADQIHTFDDQACELRSLLMDISNQ